MLRLEGPIVAQLQAVFLLSWQLPGRPAAGRRRTASTGSSRRSPDGDGHRRWRSCSTTRARATCRSRRPSDAAVARCEPPAVRDQPVPRRPRGSCAGIIDAARRGRRRPGHRPGGPALAARAARPSATGSRRFATPGSTSASIPRWPTPRSSSPTTRSSPARPTSTRSASARTGRCSCGSRTPAVADHFARELFDRDMEIAARRDDAERLARARWSTR